MPLWASAVRGQLALSSLMHVASYFCLALRTLIYKDTAQEDVLGSVVTGAFQIVFHAEIHVNDFFYFLKIIFDISTSKRSKKYKPHLILTKKKNI